MNIFNLLNRFWEAGAVEPLPPSATALYHFLLYEANRQYWRMPIRCPTAILCFRLRLSRQGLCDARNLLAEKGFIEFTPGVPGGRCSTYSLIDVPTEDLTDNLTQNLTRGLTNNLTQGLTRDLTRGLTNHLTRDLTIINTKDNKNKNINSSSLSAREEKEVLVSLDNIKSVLLSDEEWKDTLIKTINHPEVKSALDIDQWLAEFISELHAKGVTAKTIADAKSHFYNWLRRRLSDYKTAKNDKSKSTISREFDSSCYRPTETDNPNSTF